MTVSIPDDLYRQAVDIAAAQHMTVDEVIASAFAAQMAGWRRIQALAERGTKERFLAVLDKAPDVDPDPADRLFQAPTPRT